MLLESGGSSLRGTRMEIDPSIDNHGQQRSDTDTYSNTNGNLSRRRIGSVLGTGLFVGLAGCSSILGNSAEDRVMEAYQAGFKQYQTGAELHNEAVIAYRSDEYKKVETKIQEALPDLQSASDEFQTTKQIAVEEGLAEPETIASTAIEKTRLLIESSKLLKETATGFKTENYEQAQTSYDSYRSRIAAFEEAEMYPPRVLSQSLDSSFFDF